MTTRKLDLGTFEWKIPLIEDHICDEFDTLHSSLYQLRESTWRLEASKKDLIQIWLFRLDRGPPAIFTCTLKSNVNDRVVTLTGQFRRKGIPNPFIVFDLEEVLWLPNILITCCIKRNTFHQVATESFSRRHIPCVAQTDDSNSVIEKENPKNDDWSSIDIKDDTLFRERMKDLLTKGIEHDVTICVQDKQYRAHRSILSTRSPVFAMMFTHDTKEKNTGQIEIKDCEPESFYELLLYVYSGRTENLNPSNALQLYYLADKYDFPVLKERCVRILRNSLSAESICDVVLLASKHLEEELLELATEFFTRNMKKILVTDSWKKFMTQNPVEANELLIKSTDIRYLEN